MLVTTVVSLTASLVSLGGCIRSALELSLEQDLQQLRMFTQNVISGVLERMLACPHL